MKNAYNLPKLKSRTGEKGVEGQKGLIGIQGDVGEDGREGAPGEVGDDNDDACTLEKDCNCDTHVLVRHSQTENVRQQF